MRLNIKPLSVNEAWKGKRFKTTAYKQYERDLLFILPKINVPDGLLILVIKFGFSSSLSDWDNPIKPFQDILQKKYKFDDKRIKAAFAEVEQVAKGQEFVEWQLLPMSKYKVSIKEVA